MKAKNLLPLLFLALALFVNTQTIQAQTKEETVAWIKEKFEKYYPYSLVNYQVLQHTVKLSPCEIIIYGELLDKGSSGEGNSYIIHLPINSKVIVEDDNGNIRVVPDKNVDLVFHEKNDMYYGGYLLMNVRENNLAERMQKALSHLATFCDNKEAF